MATPNDYEERLKQSLVKNPTRDALAVPETPLIDPATVDQLNTFNQRIADANKKLGVSEQKQQRLAKVSEQKKQRLSTGRNEPTQPNPLAGISRDATSLRPSDEVSKALGLQPDVPTGDPRVDNANDYLSGLLLRDSQAAADSNKSLQDTISADMWDSDQAFQNEVISQADFVDTRNFKVLDGDSFMGPDGTQYRLFGVNTPETRKPESWKLTNAEGYNNTMRKARDGHRAYLNYSGQDTENFTLDNYFNNGDKAKQISEEFFKNNPSLRMVVIPAKDQSGRGATMVDWVNPQGVKLSDLLRYRPETNDGFYTDQKAIAGFEQSNNDKVLQAMRQEGVSSPSVSSDLNNNNSLLTIPRYISQGVDTAVGQAASAANTIATGIDKVGERLYAGEETAKLENVNKLEAKLKEINKEKQSAREQFVQGHYDLTKDTYAMADLQKRFKENPDGKFTTKELEALNKTGLQVDYKPFRDTTTKNRKELINTKFSIDNLDNPEVIKRVGKDLIDAVKEPKGFNKVSELQYKKILNAGKKQRKLVRDYFDQAIKENAHLTAGAKKSIAQVFDDVKEVSILENSIKDFRDGNWLSGTLEGADALGNAVYDGLAGIINHPTAGMDTVATSLGASALSIASFGAGFATMSADRIGKLQDEASELKGRELDSGEQAVVTLMSVLSAAADSGAAHSIARIGNKVTPISILKGDAEFLATGKFGLEASKKIIAEVEKKSPVLQKIATLYGTSSKNIINLGRLVGDGLKKVPGASIPGKVGASIKKNEIDPILMRILNPKTSIGKAFNSSVGTAANFGKQAVLLGVIGGKDAVVWAAKKAKELPRWGRTKTALGMAKDFIIAGGGESLTEAFVQFSEQTARNAGDWSKNDLKIIAQGAREAAAGGFIIGSPSIALGALGREKRATIDQANKNIIETAYANINATPEKIVENIRNTKAKTYDVNKAYDLLFSKDYRNIDRSESEINGDIGKVYSTLIIERLNLKKKETLTTEEEARITEIESKMAELTKFRKDVQAGFKEAIKKEAGLQVEAVPLETIKQDDFKYTETANTVINKPIETVNRADVVTAQNLLDQNEVKRKIELNSISKTDAPELIKIQEEKINAKYDTLETKLKTTISQGTKQILVSNKLKSAETLTTESVTNINDSYSREDITKTEDNLRENLIPRTTDVFGSTQTERNNHRDFLEAIVNNETLSADVKTKATSMLKLLNQFDQSAQDVKELEKNANANKIALRSGESKTIFTVFQDVLSATTNTEGKLGLKGYIDSIFTSLAQGKTDQVEAGVGRLESWTRGHKEKVVKLKQAIQKVKSMDRGSITVQLSDSSATLEIFAGNTKPAELLLKYMEHETKLMDLSKQSIKEHIKETEAIAKKDSEQLNQLGVIAETNASNIVSNKFEAKKIKDYFANDNVDLNTDESKKKEKTLLDKKTAIFKYISNKLNSLKAKEEQFKANKIEKTDPTYAKLNDEIAQLEKDQKTIQAQRKGADIEGLRLLAQYHSESSNQAVSSTDVKQSSVNELRRVNAKIKNEPETDTGIFKAEYKKQSLTKNIKKFVKDGTTVQVSDVGLKDTLKSVQAGEDVSLTELERLNAHLKNRYDKTPLRRAARAVVRNHFATVTSVMNFLKPYNISSKDVRKIAGLVSDKSIDTVESLTDKLNGLELEDKGLVTNLINELITNEAKTLVENKKVDLAKEKLTEKEVSPDTDIKLDENTSNTDILLKSVVDLLGKDHLLTKLLFEEYNKEGQYLFKKITDAIFSSVESSNITSDTVKKVRALFDGSGLGVKLSDSELLKLVLQVEKYSDLVNTKKSINIRETLTSKNSKDISETIFKNTKNFRDTLQFLLDNGVITKAQYNLSMRKYKTWFNKQNKIRLEENAYHENPKIRSIEDIINEIKLPTEIVSLIASVINANAIETTKKQLTYTVSNKKPTKVEEDYIDSSANEDFVREYSPEFPQEISDLLNYANGSIDALLKIAKELKVDSILNYQPTTTDTTKEKPPTEGQIIRRLESIIKKRLKFYGYIPTNIKDAQLFIKIIKENERVLLNYQIALDLYKEKNRALLKGDIDAVAKLSAKIEANKTLSVEQFMEGYDIVGLGKSIEQKKADEKLNIARQKQGLAPIKRPKGYYKRNTKLIEAVRIMLYGGKIDSAYLKQSEEFRKAKKAYDEYIQVLADTNQYDANQQVIEKSKDRFRLKEKNLADRKQSIVDTKNDITTNLIKSGVAIDSNTFDRILKLESEIIDANGKPVPFSKQKAEKQNTIVSDKANTRQYDSLLKRIVARFKSNSNITAEAVFFYELAYRRRVITKEFRDKRIRYIKKNPKGNNSVIGTIAKDHTKLTGKEHIIIKRLYKHDSIDRKINKKKKENVGVSKDSKKLIKVNSKEANINLTNLKTNILETRLVDQSDTNIPTKVESLQQAQSYDLATVTNQKKHYGDETAKQVYDIIKNQMVNLEDFVYQVGNSNKENMPNSVIPSKDMFTPKTSHTQAPLIAKLYGILDGLANSEKANLILRDIENNDNFKAFQDNSTLFTNIAKFYKRFNEHSTVIYGNIDSIHATLPTHLSEASEDVLRAFYSEETGKIHNQVVEVASIAFFRYYSSELLGTIDNSPDGVKSLFNIKDEETLPDETYQFGRTLGTLSAPVIQRLGQDMASMLNLKIKNPEQYANGNLEEAFHAALGNYAIEMAKEAGFIKIKSIQNKVLDGYKRGRGNQLIGELSNNPNAYTDFLTVNSFIVDGIREAPDELKQASEDYKEFKGNKFIKDLTGVTYDEQFLTRKPKYKKGSRVTVNKSIPGHKAPSLMTEMAHTASQIEWTINRSTYNDFQLFGATALTVINDIEDANEAIEAMRIPIESKARTVDTSIGYIRNILNEFRDGNPIYFENNVIRNIRVSNAPGGPRVDKNVRMLMEQVGARTELNVTNKDDFRILQQSLAVSFDVEYSDKWQEEMNEFFWLKNGSIEYHPDIMAYFELKDRGNKEGILLKKPQTELRPTKDETDADGKAITKPTWEFTAKERDLYNNGTEKAKEQAGWRPHVLAKVNELSIEDTEILKKAIDLTDGGHMGLQALSELYSIYENYNTRKTSKNLVYAPREIDGKTHGPVAVSWMIVSGRLGHSGGMETFSKVTDVMKRGGIVSDKAIAGIYEVFDQDSKDNYKKLTDVAVTRLNSILSDPTNSISEVQGTKAIIGILSKSSQVSVAKNTIAEPTADKVSIELERDFFKFILIAVIYGSSLNGIMDGKISELEQAVYKRYIEINKSNEDVFKTELKAFNETVKQIYGQDVKVPTDRLEVNQFKLTPREIHNSYNLMRSNIGTAINYATDTQLGSAIKGMKVINNMASVMAVITKLEQERLTKKAINSKAQRLKIPPENVSLTKKERNAVIAQLIKSGMMASYATPSSKGYDEEVMFMEQETTETSQKMIVKDKTGEGIKYENEYGKTQSKGSKTLPLGVRDLSKDTSVFPGTTQAMIIDSHIQGALFKLFKEGKLPELDHVFDASLVPSKGFKDKKYVNPGQAMNKALWDIERNWHVHEEISKRLNHMLEKIKAKEVDYHDPIVEAFRNNELVKNQENYKEKLLLVFLQEQNKAKFELRKKFLLQGEFDYKNNDDYRIAIRELAKKEAIYRQQLESGYSVISMWKDEIDMHLLDITLTKNYVNRNIKTIDNFPDVDSAYQIPDSERPAELNREVEMKKLADKGNRIAQWNLEHPNNNPIKTMAELNSRLSSTINLEKFKFREEERKFNEQQSSLSSSELTDYIKKFDIVYKKNVKDAREEFITSLDQLTPKQLEALNKPQKTFTNNLTNKVKKFVDSPIVVNRKAIEAKAKKIHDYTNMPSKTPKQVLAKKQMQRRYKDLVNTLIKKEYIKQQQLRNNLDEIVAYNIRDEVLLDYLSYNDVEINDKDIESMFSIDDRDSWVGWEKYKEVAKSKFDKFGFTNSSSSQVKRVTKETLKEESKPKLKKRELKREIKREAKAEKRRIAELRKKSGSKFQSNPQGARLGIKKETHRVNGSNVLTLFENISYTGGKQETKSHKEYLHDYIEETLVPLLDELDEYVHLDVHEGGDTNSGENTGAIVKLNYTHKQSRYSTHDMSQQEVFAHEFSHIFWSKMLEKGSDAYMELRDLQEKALDAITEIMREEGLPPEAIFYPRDAQGNVEFYYSEANEKKAAKEKFDYIFKSENGIYEFAVFGETNANVREAFKKHKAKNPRKTGILEFLKSIWNMLLAAFSNGHKLGKLRGGQTIDTRLQEIKKYAENEYRKGLVRETNNRINEKGINDKVSEFIADKVTGNYVKFMEKTYHPRASAIKKGKSLASKTKTVARAIAVTPLLAFSKRYGNELKTLHDAVINNRRNYAYQFFKEVKSANAKKEAQADLLHKGTSVNQRINQNIINATTRNVVEGFSDGSNFTAKDWDNLNETIVRGELHHIYQHMGMTGLIKVLNDDQALMDSIDLYKRNVIVSAKSSSISNVMLAQAESLANFTALGEPTIRNHVMNTYAISRQLMIPNAVRENYSETRMDSIEKDLDVLVSLMHLARMEPTTLENARKLIQKEYDSNRGGNNGVANMMALHYASQQEVLSAGFANNKTQLIRGHSKEDIDTHRKIIIAPLDKAKELREKYGMELYEETGNSNGVFFSKFNTEEEWQNGSFSFNTEGTNKGFDIKDFYHDLYKGDTVNARLQAAYQHIERLDDYRYQEFLKLYRGQVPSKPRQVLAPTLAPNGEVSSYRTIINHRIKREVLGMKTHAAKSIANNVSDNLNKAKSKETNKEIIKLIHEQWVNRKDYPNSKYVELDPNSKDEEIAEITQMIPSGEWEYLQSLFGKNNPVMMTDSLIPLVFGFRKGGMIEFINKRTENEMNHHLRKYLHYSARLWQAGVAEWKRTVVILTPSTFKNNFFSNTVVLRIMGLTGLKAARDQVEGLKFMTQYIKDTDELIKLQLREYSNTASKDDLLRIKALVKHITNNPVSELVEGGAYSPNVEDITIKENKIKQVYESIAPPQLVETINDIIESIPKPIRRIASNFYITRDTVASDMLTYATQVSDFTARYALYKKLTQEDKMSKEEALKAVIKQFVSYDENTSMPLQWMNDNGVWNFSKYALRSAQTVTDLYKDKPASMMLYHLLDSLTSNPIPNPTQSFIGFNGIRMNSASVEDVKESITKPALFNYIPTTPMF